VSFQLEIIDLEKIYGSGRLAVHAVKDINLSVAAGQFVALVGPSGSGKTTLLSMIGGLLSPTSGTILVNGKRVENMSTAERQRYRRDFVGFIFQANNLLPFLTAKENLLLMGQIGPGSKNAFNDKARTLIKEMGLETRTNALATELSGGEKQRVAIARALMRDPEIVLADEPTANLDSELGLHVVETLIKSVKSRNKIGIMVTHDLNMAALSDSIFQMRDGRINNIRQKTKN